MATNLLANPGFETGSFSSWTVGGAPNTQTSDNIGVDSFSYDVHSGTYGAFAGNGVTTTLSQTIATKAGTMYSVSFYLDVYQADATGGSLTASFGNTQFENLQSPAETDVFNLYTAKLMATSASTTLEFTFNDAPGFFGLDDVSVVAAPCYCPGTLIATDGGQVAVEKLRIGDRVMTRSGEPVPIRWIGRRSYGGRFVSARPGLRPIRIKQGALGDGLPQRDLLVSPEHAMFIDGVLVPARCLVNGVSIIQDPAPGPVEYVHVELPRHDVIVAEGALSESFMDDGSRGMFHNAPEYAALYPDARETLLFCAPRVEDGFALEAIWRRLAGYAAVAAAA